MSNNIKISICMAGIRTNLWEKLFKSFLGNKIKWELIIVGDRKPEFSLPDNFRWIYAPVKPSQAYEVSFRYAKGELISWSADDATYDHRQPNNLDIIYDFYKQHNNKKLVVGFRPIEDRIDVWNNHHFFGKVSSSPLMAPFAVMDKEYFHSLGGYDRRFISGQAENDVVMRVYEDGGDCKICMNAFLFVDHQGVHSTDGGVHRKYVDYYNADRIVLENMWVATGYGSYKSYRNYDRNVVILKKRRMPVEPFESKDILTITQGPKGCW